METLAAAGVRTARIEIPWGEVDYETEGRLEHDDNIRAMLAGCRRAGLRPLILLNAHHGRPTPLRFGRTRLIAGAETGAKDIQVVSTAGIMAGRTGPYGLSGDRCPEMFFSHVDGHILRLSRPLPTTLAAGAEIKFATLRYQPFSTPGTPRNDATVAGWLRYVDLIAGVVAASLGTCNMPDRGFDLEIWNELTFGSDFLDLANYDDSFSRDGDKGDDAILNEIVERTAAHVAGDPDRYLGVALANGFSSTIPWPASSQQPERVSAMTKHPYPDPKVYPADEPRGGQALGADGRPTEFVPNYLAYFPEYYGTAIQTETILRDSLPGPNPIYQTLHGRYARRPGGTTLKTDIWITEIGVDAADVAVPNGRTADEIRALFILRATLFLFGVGCTRVYPFHAYGWPENFTLLAMKRDRVDGPGALCATSRALAALQGDDTAAMGTPLPVTFGILDDSPSAVLFEGNGTAAAPSLRAIDTLTLLPFQSGKRKLAVVYYLMTRDVRRAMKPERAHLRIDGLKWRNIRARSYDPVADRGLQVELSRGPAGDFDVTLALTDSPLLLLLEDAGGGRP